MAIAIEAAVNGSPTLVTEQNTASGLRQRNFRILGTTIVRYGSCEFTTIYLSGYHPNMGRFHLGWTGIETAVERFSIKPVRTVMVVEKFDK